MTTTCAKVSKELTKLSQKEQAYLTAQLLHILLDEEIILDELEWDKEFSRSQDQLSNWSQKIEEDITAGKFRPLSFS